MIGGVRKVQERASAGQRRRSQQLTYAINTHTVDSAPLFDVLFEYVQRGIPSMPRI